MKFAEDEEPIIETYDRTFTRHRGVVQVRTDINKNEDEDEEETVEVITRPFEIEQTSKTVSVTREMKIQPTPTPLPESEYIQVRISIYFKQYFMPGFRLLNNLYNEFKLSKMLSNHRHHQHQEYVNEKSMY